MSLILLAAGDTERHEDHPLAYPTQASSAARREQTQAQRLPPSLWLLHSPGSKLLVLQPPVSNPKSSEGPEEGKRRQKTAPASGPETARALPSSPRPPQGFSLPFHEPQESSPRGPPAWELLSGPRRGSGL